MMSGLNCRGCACNRPATTASKTDTRRCTDSVHPIETRSGDRERLIGQSGRVTPGILFGYKQHFRDPRHVEWGAGRDARCVEADVYDSCDWSSDAR